MLYTFGWRVNLLDLISHACFLEWIRPILQLQHLADSHFGIIWLLAQSLLLTHGVSTLRSQWYRILTIKWILLTESQRIRLKIWLRDIWLHRRFARTLNHSIMLYILILLSFDLRHIVAHCFALDARPRSQNLMIILNNLIICNLLHNLPVKLFINFHLYSSDHPLVYESHKICFHGLLQLSSNI